MRTIKLNQYWISHFCLNSFSGLFLVSAATISHVLCLQFVSQPHRIVAPSSRDCTSFRFLFFFYLYLNIFAFKINSSECGGKRTQTPPKYVSTQQTMDAECFFLFVIMAQSAQHSQFIIIILLYYLSDWMCEKCTNPISLTLFSFFFFVFASSSSSSS